MRGVEREDYEDRRWSASDTKFVWEMDNGA